MADLKDLNLQPGDVLVVHSGAPLSPEDRKKIARDLNAEGVANTVIVMQAEPRFEVMRAAPEPKAT